MNKLATVAGWIFVLTFLLLWAVLLHDAKFASITFFAGVFVLGFVARKKQYFWKVSLFFFGILCAIYSFGVFGGLEPNSEGFLESGHWNGLKFSLFLMLMLSTVFSFLVGLRSRP